MKNHNTIALLLLVALLVCQGSASACVSDKELTREEVKSEAWKPNLMEYGMYQSALEALDNGGKVKVSCGCKGVKNADHWRDINIEKGLPVIARSTKSSVWKSLHF